MAGMDQALSRFLILYSRRRFEIAPQVSDQAASVIVDSKTIVGQDSIRSVISQGHKSKTKVVLVMHESTRCDLPYIID